MLEYDVQYVLRRAIARKIESVQDQKNISSAKSIADLAIQINIRILLLKEAERVKVDDSRECEAAG